MNPGTDTGLGTNSESWMVFDKQLAIEQAYVEIGIIFAIHALVRGEAKIIPINKGDCFCGKCNKQENK